MNNAPNIDDKPMPGMPRRSSVRPRRRSTANRENHAPVAHANKRRTVLDVATRLGSRIRQIPEFQVAGPVRRPQ